ncbi:type I polyketide synthase [Aspergillus ibericus CBS 121593]|uniref:Reducing type I polyketide synthase 10 n=1 Tax=Aspergillus ibericus CBS 121593 TaxID=1448316 RepID=A0A395GU54_9EURO|nr:reducing type I polyketide synthase 10 [Aspergillus ibericus CBS 121593]RAK98996.1 reducing type I polyketide synthase 10 [Aspergillus ibericus CBS 121593]
MEAKYMDPQQRKLLEVVFECFESAGLLLENLSGANIGCYVGNFTVDFQLMQLRDAEYMHRYTATGMGTSILGNRISHVFNLKGPSLVLDTACSSSLYCLHIACMALQAGECDGAIVAGANLIQTPEQHLATMKAGVLSPNSTCRPFSDAADGYGRADGVGALYVKRLGDALRDGDPIRSIIRASAINANGKTAGITLPSSVGQAEVIRKAYAKAGLSLNDTAYVECHGTGTAVGDPIEAEAVSLAFKRPTGSAPMLIGSVKSNLGHSEAASGISSVIKGTLALEHGFIPPTIGIQRLNPKIKSSEWNVQVVTKGREWPGGESAQVRRMGINSFGYGGANSHLILEGASSLLNSRKQQTHPSQGRTTFLFPMSASTPAALEARYQDLASYNLSNKSLTDLAYTLGERRSQLRTRGFLVANQDTLPEKLAAGGLVTLPEVATEPPSQYAFVFTGQGAQWPQMGADLLFEFPVFRAALADQDAVLQSLPNPPSWTLCDSILESSKTSQIHDAGRSQPVCIAVQVGLVDLLWSWNIRPATVLGHSSGEIAAAYAAGHLSRAQAILVAYYRGLAVKTLPLVGAMAAVGLSSDAANEEITRAQCQGQIVVACINSPESVTLSGDESAVDSIIATLQTRNVFARKLKTDGRAYHSHHMRAIGGQYETLLEASFNDHRLPSFQYAQGASFFSSVTGQPKVDGFTAAYWRENLEQPVRFVDAVSQLAQSGRHQIIELGPHSALELPIRQICTQLKLSPDHLPYSSALIRNRSSVESVLSLAGQLWLHHHPIQMSLVNQSVYKGQASGLRPQVLHDLPPYRWTYDTLLWNECRESSEFRHRQHSRHEILGSKIPAGSEVELVWRNMLHGDDAPWLLDHSLESTAVFPGSGYMAMAAEALGQALNQPHLAGHTIQFQNVHFLSALAVPRAEASPVELFTTLRRTPHTKTASSGLWWDFSIATYEQGTSTIRATGSVSRLDSQETLRPMCDINPAGLQPSAARTWYERFVDEGLNYGKAFTSIEGVSVPRSHTEKACRAQVRFTQQSPGSEGYEAEYPFHPILLDAMVQAGIIATAGGRPREMKAFVPTTIRWATLQVPGPVNAETKCFINATASPVGFGAAGFQADLVTSQNKVVAQIEWGRLRQYEPNRLSDTASVARHPMLRVLWKPKIYGQEFMRAVDFARYMGDFADEAQSMADEGSTKLMATINLLSHRNPRMRVLELGSDRQDFTVAVLDLLSADNDYRRLTSYGTGYLEEGHLHAADWDLKASSPTVAENLPVVADGEKQWDLILLPATSATWYVSNHLRRVAEFLSPDGVVLAKPTVGAYVDYSNEFDALRSRLNNGTEEILLARPLPTSSLSAVTKNKPLVIIEKCTSALGDALVASTGASRLSFDKITADSKALLGGATVISLLEVSNPLLATISDDEMDAIKAITDNASILVWVTNGDMMSGTRPDFALVSGLSRALMLEQPSLQFLTYDIDDPTTDPSRSAHNLVQTLLELDGPLADFEYVEKGGVVHISRFLPDDDLNREFRQRQGSEKIELSLQQARPVQLALDQPGQFDNIYFKQIELPALAPHEVQIQVKAVGLNAKDLYVLAGKVDSRNAACTLEFSGVVERVGDDVEGLQPGDRVVAMAPGHFKSAEIVPQWACQKLRDDEDYATMCTLPLVYSTAIYALTMRARLQPGESVLIHSGAGGVGIAAIQVAQMIGAEIYTTVSTEEKKQFLVTTFGIDPTHIFTSRDDSFARSVLAATDGKGVDVVLNSLTGDLLHASWRCCAAFGRFIEIGKHDLADDGRLEMNRFLHNATFSAFDLSDLYHHPSETYRELWSGLLDQVINLYRSCRIAKIEPLRVFNVSEINSSLRYFSSRNRIGKVVVSLESESTLIPVQISKYRTTFSPSKTYLMIGCLGGLGRSMAKWMMSRGARKFVFLGRSGMDKPSARRLIDDLIQHGAQCQVIRGDVCNPTDVESAVAAVDGLIGGVIQAAMGLSEAIFTSMTNHQWHTGIDPKVRGSWNLHHAIQGKDQALEFFLMTSSVSGSVGTATESNYCSGNFFLDTFARYRHAQGLPAQAVGLGMISEVGYLHDNPEIEALLVRKGIQAINEDELLQIIDIALSTTTPSTQLTIPHPIDHHAHAHILTGLEPFGLMALRKKGFEVTNLTFRDPRAAVLARVLDNEDDAANSSGAKSSTGSPLATELEEGIPLAEAIQRSLARRLGNLVLLPREKVQVTKPLAEFGMDSMIAAEFRTWIFRVFEVDIPFVELLSKSVTVGSLAERVLGVVASQ